MSEPKWTPGPWRAVEPSDRLPYWNIWDTNDRGFDVWVCTLKSNAAPIEEEPNAHLIAAAPELYEALAAMVEWEEEADPYPTSDEHPLYIARAALAKARGEDGG